MGKKNGYIDMVGDLFHYGHLRLIQKIHNMGYNVIVGVHDDKTVESYKRKPILNMIERIEIIQSCKYIDFVIPNSPLIITKKYLEENNIDMVFHAHSLEEKEKYENMYKIPTKMGKFTRIDYTKEISTTEIINRILNRNKNK